MAGMRKQPQRTCVGCGECKEKRELIRIVRTPEGVFTVDFTGKANGRGAYLCRNSGCLEAAMKNHGLERSFHQAISPDQMETLRKELEAG